MKTLHEKPSQQQQMTRQESPTATHTTAKDYGQSYLYQEIRKDMQERSDRLDRLLQDYHVARHVCSAHCCRYPCGYHTCSETCLRHRRSCSPHRSCSPVHVHKCSTLCCASRCKFHRCSSTCYCLTCMCPDCRAKRLNHHQCTSACCFSNCSIHRTTCRGTRCWCFGCRCELCLDRIRNKVSETKPKEEPPEIPKNIPKELPVTIVEPNK